MEPIIFIRNTRSNMLLDIPYKLILWLLGILRSGVTKKFTRRHLERFVAYQATDEPVLDLGCASSPYAKYFPRMIALDIAKRGDSGLDVIGDAHCLPLRSGSFPMVLATELLEHVREPQQLIDEILRILEPGGRLVLTTRFVLPLHDAPHDFFRFTKYGLKHLL
jgi:SAM-dependent methyltransferase